MKHMLIDKAYRVLMLAKEGNNISVACFNDWAKKHRLPLFPHSEYDTVKTYDDFYNLTYYYWFSD